MNYVHWYDDERLHDQLGNVTPEEYEQAHHASTTGSPSGDAANKPPNSMWHRMVGMIVRLA